MSLNILPGHQTEPETQVPLIQNQAGFPIFWVWYIEPESTPQYFGGNQTEAKPSQQKYLT